ncbi:MAG: hypothetical protein H7346_07715 [Burkholderiaceae bacterium]|nr:hypothetical protein [Burkholderiaceae bacterium]
MNNELTPAAYSTLRQQAIALTGAKPALILVGHKGRPARRAAVVTQEAKPPRNGAQYEASISSGSRSPSQRGRQQPTGASRTQKQATAGDAQATAMQDAAVDIANGEMLAHPERFLAGCEKVRRATQTLFSIEANQVRLAQAIIEVCHDFAQKQPAVSTNRKAQLADVECMIQVKSSAADLRHLLLANLAGLQKLPPQQMLDVMEALKVFDITHSPMATAPRRAALHRAELANDDLNWIDRSDSSAGDKIVEYDAVREWFTTEAMTDMYAKCPEARLDGVVELVVARVNQRIELGIKGLVDNF